MSLYRLNLFGDLPTKFCCRYVDLHHVQQITELRYECRPARVEKDDDGIDVFVNACGYATFQYQMAFQDKWENFEQTFEERRAARPARTSFEVLRLQGWPEGTTVDDVTVMKLEAFKAGYEKFFAARAALDTSLVYKLHAG